MASPGGITSELESFREQWRAEVRARNTTVSSSSADIETSTTSLSSAPPTAFEPPRKTPPPVKATPKTDDGDRTQAHSLDHTAVEASLHDRPHAVEDDGTDKEPVSALDFYERAVDKEALGSLGDSLKLYRKAFRMDSRVDQIYKKKHFPAATGPRAPAQPQATTSKPDRQSGSGQLMSMEELIGSFTGLSIEPAPPEIEGMPKPSCPIAGLPDEILVHILRDLAIMDVGDFVRLSQVCKRLAYLVGTEDWIWRRVCLGAEFGFKGMYYDWQLGVRWGPLVESAAVEAGVLSLADLARRQEEEKLAASNVFLNSLYRSSWQRMFRLRPRLRFNGCYISTVNYIRAGQASAHQITWNSPVHIVTYYRYLRFFRDGSAISLLTTADPVDVVHHLTPELLALHRDGAHGHLPSVVMQSALRGRWRLSAAADAPDRSLSEVEGDVFVETEGVGRYIYRMELVLRSAGKAASSHGDGGPPRNTKLAWRGFYSYNRLTDDWGEFGLKNDKPFFFSRVKSYGTGA